MGETGCKTRFASRFIDVVVRNASHLLPDAFDTASLWCKNIPSSLSLLSQHCFVAIAVFRLDRDQVTIDLFLERP